MTNPEELAVNAQRAMDAGDAVAAAQPAADYAAAWEALCRRVERCSTLLENKDRSGALAAAEEDVSLPRLFESLEFPRLAQWREFCQDNGLPVPPQPPAYKLSKLLDVYSDKLALEPLIAEFRAKNRGGSLDEKIFLMRKIRGIDPTNPDWKETLLRLEQDRLPQLVAAARQAIEDGDGATLEVVERKLVGPGCLLRPEEKVLQKIERQLRQLRAARARVQADQALAAITTAYSLLDPDKLALSMAKWDQILGDRDFKPEPSDCGQATEARQWLAKQLAERKGEQDFHALQDQLNAALDEQTEEKRLDQLYYQLKSADRPLPELVDQRYRLAKAVLKRGRDLAFRGKLAAAVLATAVALVGLGLLVNMRLESQTFKKWDQQLGEELAAGRLESAAALLEAMRAREPKLAGRPEILAKERRLKELKTEFLDKKIRFEELATALRAAAAENFQGAAPVDALFAEADATAPDGPSRLELSRLKDERQRLENAARLDRDNRFAAALRQANAQFADLEAQGDPAADLPRYRLAARAFEARAQELQHGDGVSPELRDSAVKLLNARVALVKDALAQAERAASERRSRLDAISATVIPLDTYKLKLKDFVDKFPDDHNVAGFEAVLDAMPQLEAAERLRDFKPNALAPPQAAALQDFLKASAGKNVWENDLRALLDQQRRGRQNSPEVRDNLKKLADRKVMNFNSMVFKAKDGAVLEFPYLGEPAISRPKINGRELPDIRCRIMGDQDDTKGEMVRFVQGLDGSWTMEADGAPAWDGLRLLSGPGPSPQKAFFAETLGQLVRADDATLPELCAAELIRLNTETAMNPFLKTQLAGRLLDSLAKLSFANGERYDLLAVNLAKATADVPEGFNWMDLDAPGRSRFSTLVEQLPDLKPLAAADALALDLLRQALGRRLHVVGVVRDVEGEKLPDLRVGGAPAELWALNVGVDDKAEFVVVGKTEDGKASLSQDFSALLREGQPLFAPQDDLSTQTLAEGFKSRANGEAMPWPSSWPVNRR